MDCTRGLSRSVGSGTSESFLEARPSAGASELGVLPRTQHARPKNQTPNLTPRSRPLSPFAPRKNVFPAKAPPQATGDERAAKVLCSAKRRETGLNSHFRGAKGDNGRQQDHRFLISRKRSPFSVLFRPFRGQSSSFVVSYRDRCREYAQSAAALAFRSMASSSSPWLMFTGAPVPRGKNKLTPVGRFW